MYKQLISAIINNDIQEVRCLLNNGVCIHDDDGCPLRMASTEGHFEIVNELLNHGANVHAKNDQALAMACVNGHHKVVQLLLEHGADIHARGNVSLMVASENGHLEVVQVLLDYGISLNIVYNVAIHAAYEKKHFNTVAFLLSKYKPHKDDDAFTTMIAINNFELTRQYNKRLSRVGKSEFVYEVQTHRRISKYIIRNTAINNKRIARAIYATNYRIHQTKVSKPTNRLVKQYKN